MPPQSSGALLLLEEGVTDQEGDDAGDINDNSDKNNGRKLG